MTRRARSDPRRTINIGRGAGPDSSPGPGVKSASHVIIGAGNTPAPSRRERVQSPPLRPPNTPWPQRDYVAFDPQREPPTAGKSAVKHAKKPSTTT